MNRLYRSRTDKWFTGLLGGLGEYFGFSSTILRILVIVSVPFTSGAVILIYLIASLVVSKEPYQPYDPYNNNGWNGGGGYGGGYGGNPGGPGGPGYGYGGPRPPQRPPHPGPMNSGPMPPNSFNGNTGSGFGAPHPSNLDSMMEDIEKKAMEKELEELRKKLSKYEKGEV